MDGGYDIGFGLFFPSGEDRISPRGVWAIGRGQPAKATRSRRAGVSGPPKARPARCPSWTAWAMMPGALPSPINCNDYIPLPCNASQSVICGSREVTGMKWSQAWVSRLAV